MNDTDDAARLRNAMSDLEYLFLENQLRADAAYIGDCTLNGKEDEAQAYMRDTKFIERRNAWRAGRRA